MKNIKGIQRKAKYEVQSIEVLGFSYEGFGRFMSADIRLRRTADKESIAEFMYNIVKGEDMSELRGMRSYFISVRVPVRQWARKNRSHKPNDWKGRTIATLAVDEIEAYNLAKKAIQAHWQRAFKLNRYAKR